MVNMLSFVEPESRWPGSHRVIYIPQSEAIKERQKINASHGIKVSDEDALLDFIVVHWAKRHNWRI